MTFEEMWAEADFIDAATGGMDSVPEEEEEDYVGALLMANGWVCQGLVFRKEGI